jgi:ABC-type sulfate transport system substrate-binding protein
MIRKKAALGFSCVKVKYFAIAFAALWLSQTAFAVNCQSCHGLPTSGNRSIIDGVGC